MCEPEILDYTEVNYNFLLFWKAFKINWLFKLKKTAF